MDCSLPGSSVHGILQVRILEWVAISFSRGSSQPRDWTQVSHIAGGFFTVWAPVKPKNTGVGRLSLLQRIFLTQESNQGLLHRRWILYQLSYQRSPLNGNRYTRQTSVPFLFSYHTKKLGRNKWSFKLFAWETHSVRIFKHYQLIFKQEPDSGPRKWKLK